MLTYRGDDAHQDHRQIARLAWNTFRNHLIPEYEIPKWDGDMAIPDLYVAVSASTIQRKIDLLNFRTLVASVPSSGSMLKPFSAWHG
jgi:LmbE family N-acetylglucosaminyl deacetylase